MTRIIIIVGAGLSAESGIATFRDKNGLWENNRIDEVCNIHTWQRNFEKVHRFYNQRRVQLGTVEPNNAHKAIARWAGQREVVVLSQNIDDLLERAGYKIPLHVHGYLTEMRCMHCRDIWDIGYREWRCEEEVCPSCERRQSVKPNVVFFGEEAPGYRTLSAVLEGIVPSDYLIVIGTSGRVLPIDRIAESVNCTKILNNLEETAEIDGRNFNHVFYEPATSAIGKIERIIG